MKVNIVKIAKHNLTPHGKVRFILINVNTGKIKTSEWIENIIPLCGRTAICRGLRGAGVKTNEGIILYGAVGTSFTTPLDTDIKLGAELKRKVFSKKYNIDNTVVFRTFFSTSEANGELKEFGLFGEDATVAADSGTLFERVLFSETKTDAETLIVESSIVIS